MSKKVYCNAKAVPIEIDGEKVYAQFGKSSKGNDQVLVSVEIQDGEFKGRTFSWFGYFTDADVADRTLESLRNLGLKGDDVAAAVTGPLDNVAPVTMEEDTYEGKTRWKVAWINKPGSGGGFKMEKRMDKTELLNFSAKLRARLASKAEIGTPAPVVTNGTANTEDVNL